jgi:hypothetical protein
MNHLKINHSCSSRCLRVAMTLTALAVLALASIPVARASEDNRAPDLPSPLCDRLEVSPEIKWLFMCSRWACKSTDGTAPVGSL